MSEHTPGPWQVSERGDQTVIRGAAGEVVAFVGNPVMGAGPVTISEWGANSYLLAAAPEMLAVLQRLGRRGGLGFDYHERIAAVIAKATGQ